ncbi:PhzF family phenazine biosynthesis protein [Nocardia transvalensis]|uniref:PhzF family phenazine biosynthesis protein n=1 Tax=Nocardia transvalensis TaxID=37333 RepID=UPI001894CC0D|nr:PhzF family phenazine biosynthesis protein [Nocardia transvalensis]MBF6329936.1 PhzF family phenazine biosynthesis protein [Nocardia transvalensis]
MEYTFVIADVFTETPFGGNQLAVFPDAGGLSEQQMQDLAREFGFSETTFAFPPENPDHTRRLRIFTPSNELPFAGHPTVGTASVLAAGGFVDTTAPETTLILEETVGPIAVRIDGTYSRLIFTPPFRRPEERPTLRAVAAALSLSGEVVRGCWYGSVGVPFCLVHLADSEAVDRAAIDRAEWSTGLADGWSPHLFVFAGDLDDGSTLHARMFAPDLRIEEDPATGSAAAALVASLVQDSAHDDTDYHLRITQGVRMGRPSLIDASAHRRSGRLSHVTIGGHTTVIGQGVVSLPDM